MSENKEEIIDVVQYIYDIDYIVGKTISELLKEVRAAISKKSYEYEPSGPPTFGEIDSDGTKGWVQLMVQMDEEEI